MADITKTGPQTHSEITKEIEDKFENLRPKEDKFEGLRPVAGPDISAFRDAPRLTESPLANTETPFGESYWDEGELTSDEFERIGSIRGENQNGFLQVANGIAKGGILAGTTIINGVVGFPAGLFAALGTGLKEGDWGAETWSKIWDNEILNTTQKFVDWSEKAIPNYYTEAELTSPWYTNIFTGNFIGDKFLKNIGFTVGALYSGGVYSAGLGNLFRALGAIGDAASATTALIGAGISAVNEGSIEALNGAREYEQDHLPGIEAQYEQEIRNIGDWYNRNKGKNYVHTKEGKVVDQAWLEYQQMAKEVQDNHDKALARLQEDKARVGNTILMMQLPLLTLSNAVQFAKVYSQGFKPATKYKVTGPAGNYKGVKTGFAEGTAKILTGAAWEGTEEVGQQIDTDFAKTYYSTDFDNFYRKLYDPNAEEKANNALQTFADSAYETLGRGDTWEQFFIGAITGMLGAPRFRSIRDKDGKLRSPIVLEDNVISRVSDIRRTNQANEAMAKKLNERAQSPEFQNYYRGWKRHVGYDDQMDAAIDRGDAFVYKNAELGQLISDTEMFRLAGKTDDLKALIRELGDTSIPNMETVLKGSENAPKTQQQLQDERDKVQKDTQNILSMIDRYEKALEKFDSQTGHMLEEDELAELVWMSEQLNDWEKRGGQMTKEITKALSAVEQYITSQKRVISGTLESAAEYEKNSEQAKELQNTLELYEKFLNTLQTIKAMKEGDIIATLSANPGLVNAMKETLQQLPVTLMKPEDLKDIMPKLNDIIRIGEAGKRFAQKLAEYLSAPKKIREERAKIRKEEEKKRHEVETRKNKDLVAKAQNFQELDALEKEGVLSDETGEGLEITQEHKHAKKALQSILDAIEKSGSANKKALKTIARSIYNRAKSLEDLFKGRPQLSKDSTKEEETIASEYDKIINDVKDTFKKLGNYTAPSATPKPTGKMQVLGPDGVGAPPARSQEKPQEKPGTEAPYIQDGGTEEEVRKEMSQYPTTPVTGVIKTVIPRFDLDERRKGRLVPFVREGFNQAYKWVYNKLSELQHTPHGDMNAFDYLDGGFIKKGDGLEVRYEPATDEHPELLALYHNGVLINYMNTDESIAGVKEIKEKAKEAYNARSSTAPSTQPKSDAVPRTVAYGPGNEIVWVEKEKVPLSDLKAGDMFILPGPQEYLTIVEDNGDFTDWLSGEKAPLDKEVIELINKEGGVHRIVEPDRVSFNDAIKGFVDTFTKIPFKTTTAKSGNTIEYYLKTEEKQGTTVITVKSVRKGTKRAVTAGQRYIDYFGLSKLLGLTVSEESLQTLGITKADIKGVKSLQYTRSDDGNYAITAIIVGKNKFSEAFEETVSLIQNNPTTPATEQKTSDESHVSNPTITVTKVMDGSYGYSREVSQPVGSLLGTDQAVIGVATKNGFVSNSEQEKDPVINPKEATGRVYILLPNSRGTLTPIRVYVRHFNKEEYDINKDNPIANKLREIIRRLAELQETKGGEGLKKGVDEAFNELVKVLHVPDTFHLDYYDTAMGFGLKIGFDDGTGKRKDITIPMYDITLGKASTRVIGENNEVTVVESSLGQQPTIESIIEQITDALQQANLAFNINAKHLAGKQGNTWANMLRDSDVLYTFLTGKKQQGTWLLFNEEPKSNDMQDDRSKQDRETLTSRGTEIRLGIARFYYKDGAWYNAVGEEAKDISPEYKERLDAALEIVETYGQAMDGMNMVAGKAILKNGKGFDRINGVFLTKEETEKLIQDIEKSKKEHKKPKHSLDELKELSDSPSVKTVEGGHTLTDSSGTHFYAHADPAVNRHSVVADTVFRVITKTILGTYVESSEDEKVLGRQLLNAMLAVGREYKKTLDEAGITVYGDMAVLSKMPISSRDYKAMSFMPDLILYSKSTGKVMPLYFSMRMESDELNESLSAADLAQDALTLETGAGTLLIEGLDTIHMLPIEIEHIIREAEDKYLKSLKGKEESKDKEDEKDKKKDKKDEKVIINGGTEVSDEDDVGGSEEKVEKETWEKDWDELTDEERSHIPQGKDFWKYADTETRRDIFDCQ